MGNNHPSPSSSSSSSGTQSSKNPFHNGGPFRRPTGSLGLSRAELDERCKPSGLYESCSWDDRTIRKLIGDGKLASRLKGKDDRTTGTEQECPICFFHYDEINMLKCCKATICTECYLQVQHPNAHSPLPMTMTMNMRGGGGGGENKAPCPFCNKPHMSIVVAKRLDDGDVKRREEEEQKVIEATIRARANSHSESMILAGNTSEETFSSGTTGNGNGTGTGTGTGSGGFGSRLHQEMMETRSRSSSLSSSLSSSNPNNNNNNNNNNDTINTIQNAAVTPEERRALEDQMRSQLNHPLMIQMQRNAELQSQRHLLEHAERRRDRIQTSREELGRLIDRAREREHGLNLFAGTFDRSPYEEEDDLGSGSYGDDLLARLEGERGSRPPSMNDLYLLEAALYLSAREDSRRRRRNRSRSNRLNRNDNSLLRALLSGRGDGLRRGGDNSADNDSNGGTNANGNQNDNAAENGGTSEQDEGDNATNGNSRSNNDRDIDRPPFSAADILFAGLSEANQLEMAIQMSIRDEEERQERERQQQQQQQQEEEENEGGENEPTENENEPSENENRGNDSGNGNNNPNDNSSGNNEEQVVDNNQENTPVENSAQAEGESEERNENVDASVDTNVDVQEENATQNAEATENTEAHEVMPAVVDDSETTGSDNVTTATNADADTDHPSTNQPVSEEDTTVTDNATATETDNATATEISTETATASTTTEEAQPSL